MEMDNSMDQQQSSTLSWWWDTHNRPPQSQWLHSTLAELDEKIKTILDLIEDNGDTFAERAEMYYQKRPQLIKMVQELHRSYRALADQYDHLLKSESSIRASNSGSVSNSFSKSATQPLQNYAKRKPKPQTNTSDEAPHSISESIEVLSAADSKTDISSFELPSRTSFDLMNEADDSKCNNNMKSKLTAGENGVIMIKERFWDEQMKFSQLLEENLSKQAELIRRNDEKREVINGLRNENRISSQKSRDGSRPKGRMKGKDQSQKRKLVKGFFCLA